MNRMFNVFIMIFGMLPFCTYAGVKVASLDLTTKGTNGYINIALDGRASELPDVKVLRNTIEIILSKSGVFNAITKNVRGAQLSANVLNGKAVVKAVLPYEVSADSLEVGWKNNGLEIVFPRGKSLTTEIQSSSLETVKDSSVVATKTITKTTEVGKNEIIKKSLNEDYLNNLMKESSAKVEVIKEEKDEVKVTQSAPAIEANMVKKGNAGAIDLSKNSNADTFSFAGYATKFTLFLAIVLGLFWGVVQVLKKGVFNRGKLGFLNNSQMIEVLSTTYVSPKRSLMVVRAHKQIFLVGNSETGLVFLSEMTDTSGLLKEGERQITGTNFDVNLSDADKNENELIKLKENIMDSTPVKEQSGVAKISAAKDDIVKFSEELKKKAKKLKPIEFN